MTIISATEESTLRYLIQTDRNLIKQVVDWIQPAQQNFWLQVYVKIVMKS